MSKLNQEELLEALDTFYRALKHNYGTEKEEKQAYQQIKEMILGHAKLKEEAWIKNKAMEMRKECVGTNLHTWIEFIRSIVEEIK